MAAATLDKAKIKARIPEAVSSFIKKTFELLEDQKFVDIVDWNAEGTAIIIKNPTDFGQKVLPTYFKHSNLTSFVRQLNMYDFHKRRTQKYDHVYYHDLFQRSKRHLLQDIKRKNQDNTLANIQKAIETLETAQGGPKTEVNASNYETQLLKKLNKDALARISSLESKVKELTVQNQALWNQVNHQSQKEDLLVSLLASFLKKKGITLDQLPKMLSNQFNLPHLDLCSDLKTFESGNRRVSMEDNIEKLVMTSHVDEFLNVSEGSCSSTEISPGEMDKPYGANESVLEVQCDQKYQEVSQEVRLTPMDQGWGAPINNYPGSWGMMCSAEKMAACGEEDYGKRYFGQAGMLGKRVAEVNKDCEGWNTQKMLKQNQFGQGLMNPFNCGNNNGDVVLDMKIRKNDSLTDMYLTSDSQIANSNLDLLNFS